MLNMLKSWTGSIIINDVSYTALELSKLTEDVFNGNMHIILKSNQKNAISANAERPGGLYRVTVRQYMTRKATPEFDFMDRWNANVPMPLRTMTGTIVKETRGMVYMKLHGDIWAEKIHHCMKCGKLLTNPVSQYFGIGPECGNHNYVNPFDTDEELRDAVSAYKKQLHDITWEGWIIKSAITEQVEL